MKFRKLRIAFSLACAITFALLIALWVRSYWRADSLLWHYYARYALQMRICTGQIQFEAFIDEPSYIDVFSAGAQIAVEYQQKNFAANA